MVTMGVEGEDETTVSGSQDNGSITNSSNTSPYPLDEGLNPRNVSSRNTPQNGDRRSPSDRRASRGDRRGARKQRASSLAPNGVVGDYEHQEGSSEGVGFVERDDSGNVSATGNGSIEKVSSDKDSFDNGSPAENHELHSSNSKSDARWSLLLEVGRLFAGLTTFYLIGKVLGTEELGRYAAISSFVSLLNTLAATWLPQWVMESVVRRRRPAKDSVNSAIGANISFAAVIVVGAFFVTPLLLKKLLAHVALQWVLLFLLAELLANCSLVWISVWSIKRGYAASCRVSLLHVLLRPILYISLWAGGILSLRSMSITSLIWALISVATVYVITGKLLRENVGPGKFDRRLFIEGAPYAMTNVAYVIQEDFDKPLMIEFGHKAEAGTYAAAYRLIQIAMVPLRSLVLATHLRFLETGQRSGSKLVVAQAIFLSAVSSGLAVFLGLGVVFVGQPLAVRYMGRDYSQTKQILLPLIPLLVLRGLSWFPLNGLMALGHLRERVVVLFTSASINVILNLALIPRYSWKGAVISTLVAEVVFASLAWGFLFAKHPDDFRKYSGSHYSHFRKSQSRKSKGGPT
jgi:O-antigen/teichoic acid export membrane protein